MSLGSLDEAFLPTTTKVLRLPDPVSRLVIASGTWNKLLQVLVVWRARVSPHHTSHPTTFLIASSETSIYRCVIAKLLCRAKLCTSRIEPPAADIFRAQRVIAVRLPL